MTKDNSLRLANDINRIIQSFASSDDSDDAELYSAIINALSNLTSKYIAILPIDMQDLAIATFYQDLVEMKEYRNRPPEEKLN